MSPEPLAYSQQNMDKAIAYVHDINADLGGTELYHPLASLLKHKPCVGSSRQIILLTDGQISNEPAVIALARKYRSWNRIFTFGIGPASSRHLIRGLAEATRGAAEFITEGERIEEKVLRTFSRLSTPALTDLAVQWETAGELEQAPAEIPPLFDGDAMVVYARCAGKGVPGGVTLRCDTPAGPRAWTMNISPAHGGREMLPLLWARRMIQSLEEADGDSPAGKERLVTLSKESGLLCRYTNFIAVEHRSPEERNSGCPATRRIPVQIPRGWHGIEAESLGDVLCCLDSLDLSGPREFSAPSRARGILGRIWRVSRPVRSSEVSALLETSPRETEAQPSALTTLLATQQADGSFTGGDDSLVAGWTAAKQKAEVWLLEQCSRPYSGLTDRILSTVAMLIILNRAFPGYRSIWKRAARKARRYLAKELNLTVNLIEVEIDRLSRAG